MIVLKSVCKQKICISFVLNNFSLIFFLLYFKHLAINKIPPNITKFLIFIYAEDNEHKLTIEFTWKDRLLAC